ncbi:hypothetical protein ACFFQW_37375 [Umezawaea endophytica]|uniref:Uncharacterized protein n=1 Tax=Umezawaea endophytica TaxID=1654476 RepID=A0A9X2VXA0_9PSEU|nr:hypothetical protein [Umezawaea endophytica]MCS7483383.1 hypothetical protein [Umezawaea endophytica]
MVSDSRPLVTGCLVKILVMMLGAILGTVLTVVAGVVLFIPDRTTVRSTPQSPQGPGVFVKEVGSIVGSTSFEVWIGPDESRGTVVPIPRGWGGDPDAVFESGGTRLRFDNGAEIFVPSTAGGR